MSAALPSGAAPDGGTLTPVPVACCSGFVEVTSCAPISVVVAIGTTGVAKICLICSKASTGFTPLILRFKARAIGITVPPCSFISPRSTFSTKAVARALTASSITGGALGVTFSTLGATFSTLGAALSVTLGVTLGATFSTLGVTLAAGILVFGRLGVGALGVIIGEGGVCSCSTLACSCSTLACSCSTLACLSSALGPCKAPTIPAVSPATAASRAAEPRTPWNVGTSNPSRCAATF